MPRQSTAKKFEPADPDKEVTPDDEDSVKESHEEVRPSKLEMLGSTGERGRAIPRPVVDTAKVVKGLDDVLKAIADFRLSDADRMLTELIQHEPARAEELKGFSEQTAEVVTNAKRAIKDSKKAKKELKKSVDLSRQRVLTVDEMLTLVSHYSGAQSENNDFLDRLLSSKKLRHKKNTYQILRYRFSGGNNFVRIDGFEHVQFLEQEVNRGWIPLEKEKIIDVLEKQEMKSVKKMEKGAAQSPKEIVDFIVSLRDRKLAPEMIRKEIMEKKPAVEAAGVTARANYYLEKGGEPLLHFEGLSKRIWGRIDAESVAVAVRLSKRLAVIDAELKREKPFGIESVEMALMKKTPDKKRSIDDDLILQLRSFFSPDQISDDDIKLLQSAHKLLVLV
jgi:hypothetical protein